MDLPSSQNNEVNHLKSSVSTVIRRCLQENAMALQRALSNGCDWGVDFLKSGKLLTARNRLTGPLCWNFLYSRSCSLLYPPISESPAQFAPTS